MDGPLDEGKLIGTWVHSREEDTGAESVYRPKEYAFPPARGRTGYEFKADHTCEYLGIAAADGTDRQPCKWKVGPTGSSEVIVTFSDGREQVLRIEEAETDRLVIRKG